MKKFIVLLTLACILTACGHVKQTKETTVTDNTEKEPTTTVTTKTENPKPISLKTYDGQEFSISYPSTWENYDLSQLNQPLLKIAFVDPSPKIAFADNVNVAVDNSGSTAKQTADLVDAQYIANSKSFNMKNYKKVSFTNYTTYHKNAGILKAEYTLSTTNVDVILTQYLVPLNNQMYTLSISLSKESYDNGGEEVVQQIIESLKLHNSTQTSSVDNSATPSTNTKTTKKTNTADVMSMAVTSAQEDSQIDAKTYQYIIDHYKLFPAVDAASKKSAKALVASNITSRHIFKNITPYLDKMVEFSGEVLQIQEEETEYGTMATIHITDENDNSIVGIYMNSTGDILDGDFVTMRGIPTLLYYFDNIGGGTTNALLLTVSTIQKQ